MLLDCPRPDCGGQVTASFGEPGCLLCARSYSRLFHPEPRVERSKELPVTRQSKLVARRSIYGRPPKYLD